METRHQDTRIDAIAASVIAEAHRRGYSIARVADLSGVDRSVISRWLGGRRSVNVATAAKVLEALQLRIVPTTAERNGTH